MPDRTAIVGSRSYLRSDIVEAFVSGLPTGMVVVSGGAPGVDSIAEHAARQRGLEVMVFRADWERHGRKAGPLRNAEIVAYADRVVAFWDGQSRGTLNTVVQAVRAGRPAGRGIRWRRPAGADRGGAPSCRGARRSMRQDEVES